MAEAIKPSHYNFTITNSKGHTIECDLLDIANAMNLSLEQYTALRYFRVKGGLEKVINDNDKAIQCLVRNGERLVLQKQEK